MTEVFFERKPNTSQGRFLQLFSNLPLALETFFSNSQTCRYWGFYCHNTLRNISTSFDYFFEIYFDLQPENRTVNETPPDNYNRSRGAGGV